MTHGFPLKSSPLFTSSKEFLIENRMGGGFMQDAGALYRYLQSGKIVDLASDFHFLLFTRSMSILNDNVRRVGFCVSGRERLGLIDRAGSWSTN